jgi:hypothetical protein
MNDRGLSLSPTDMLKGYLLANITDEAAKLKANHTWKDRIGKHRGLPSGEWGIAGKPATTTDIKELLRVGQKATAGC